MNMIHLEEMRILSESMINVLVFHKVLYLQNILLSERSKVFCLISKGVNSITTFQMHSSFSYLDFNLNSKLSPEDQIAFLSSVGTVQSLKLQLSCSIPSFVPFVEQLDNKEFLSLSLKHDSKYVPICPILHGKKIMLTSMNLCEWNFVETITTIEELKLNSCTELRKLPSMNNLRLLALTRSSVRSIPTFPNCKEILLTFCEDLCDIAIQPKLMEIEIRNCYRLEDISGLKLCKNISLIDCPRVKFHEHRIDGLDVILYEGNVVNYDSLVNYLSYCSTLTLNRTTLSFNGTFPSLQNLRKVVLFDISIRSIDLPSTNLFYLTIMKCKQLEKIADCKHIQELFISDCPRLTDVHDFFNINRLQILSCRNIKNWGTFTMIGEFFIHRVPDLELVLKTKDNQVWKESNRIISIRYLD